MKVKLRKYGRDRRRLMEPLAVRKGLVYDHEALAPGSSPAQIAFQAVGCGADVLSGLRYPDNIPTENRRVGKAVARDVAGRFGGEESRHAAIFLAEAFAVWFEEMTTHEGDSTSAAVHLFLRNLIDEFFPLEERDHDRLTSLREEFRVLETHDVEGRFPANGWYMALRDAEFAEGRDPHTDPELLQVQLRYASYFLRLGTEKYAIAVCVGDDAFEAIAEHLFHPHYSISSAVVGYDLGDLSWWTDCGEAWHECGVRALELP